MLNIDLTREEKECETYLSQTMGLNSLMILSSLMAESIGVLQSKLLNGYEVGPDKMAEKRVAMGLTYLNIVVKQLGYDEVSIKREAEEIYAEFTAHRQQRLKEDVQATSNAQTPNVVPMPEQQESGSTPELPAEALMGALAAGLMNGEDGVSSSMMQSILEGIIGNDKSGNSSEVVEEVVEEIPAEEVQNVKEETVSQQGTVWPMSAAIDVVARSKTPHFRIEIYQMGDLWDVGVVYGDVREPMKEAIKTDTERCVYQVQRVDINGVIQSIEFLILCAAPSKAFDVVVAMTTSGAASWIFWNCYKRIGSDYKSKGRRILPYVFYVSDDCGIDGRTYSVGRMRVTDTSGIMRDDEEFIWSKISFGVRGSFYDHIQRYMEESIDRGKIIANMADQGDLFKVPILPTSFFGLGLQGKITFTLSVDGLVAPEVPRAIFAIKKYGNPSNDLFEIMHPIVEGSDIAIEFAVPFDVPSDMLTIIAEYVYFNPKIEFDIQIKATPFGEEIKTAILDLIKEGDTRPFKESMTPDGYISLEISRDKFWNK